MRCISLTLVILITAGEIGFAADEQASREAIAKFVRDLDPQVSTADRKDLHRTLGNDVRRRRRTVNEQDVMAWRAIKSVEEWERFKAARIAKLRQSLGEFPQPPEDLHSRVTRTIPGDGFQIECVVFESRPGLFVTANLYRPARVRESMPGILICHSHHNPKTQSELQDMGMNWARAECLVLVMDQVGHGERRQHPFPSSKDYEKEFRVSRQDYHFRYNVGMQLHLIGDSLIGWMAWDLMRGVDLLLGQPGVDSKKIILLGAVAGGGDPCAVTAAIDERIAAAVPFNFGGPQPENVFPLPADAELSFNYVGGGSWESTRNLRVSARDGFLPWVIVGSIAPRRLIYAHEFRWDRENDPVWRRFQTIYKWYDAPDHLDSLLGYGQVSLTSKEASHCNNIGQHHRRQIYPAFDRWFGIETPDPEHRDRHASTDLYCVEGVDAARDIELTPVHKLANHLAGERITRFRDELSKLPAERRRKRLQSAWSRVLGFKPPAKSSGKQAKPDAGKPIRVTRLVHKTDEFSVPLMLLSPDTLPDEGCPCVVAVAQGGKAAFLKERSEQIAGLLNGGVAVCLLDLAGTGETSPGNYRGRRSSATGISSARLMHHGTIMGDRLRDLLSVIQGLRKRDEVNGKRIAIWGDSFAPANEPDRKLAVPLGVDAEPRQSEPMGATLSLLAALFDPQIKAVVARGGLVSLRSILDSQFVYVPHDFIIPGALTTGDLADIAAALDSTPVRIDGIVDGTNRNVSSKAMKAAWKSASDKQPSLEMSAEPTDDYVTWLLEALKK